MTSQSFSRKYKYFGELTILNLNRDTFYIQFFQSVFADFDFSPLENKHDERSMAANIQSLIDLLSSKILKYDLGHI